MKIKALHIAAFGGIKNLDLNLENSFNVVYGQNENGKTTIMNFIKMMFYGTERGSAQLSKNLRKRYTPWDQSQMAGYIIFEKDGRSYRLERIFGSSNSTDKVTLFDLSLGTAETVAADIGSKLFGLSVSAFERSIFIGQFGFPDTNDAGIGELNGKLSNIALTGDETISYDAVNKRLETAKTQLMSKSGRSGVYDKNLKLCADLEKELQKATQTQEIIGKANQKLAEIRSEIEVLQQKASLLKQQLDSENDLRNSEKLKELLNLKEKLDEINKELTLTDGKLADEMFVRKVEFCLSKIQKIKDKISSKQNENQLLESNLNLALNAGSSATPENAEALQKKIICLEEEKQSISEQITKLEQNTQKPFSTVWFVLASVFAILGAGGYLISQFLTVGGLSLALIFVLIGLIANSKAKTKANQKQSAILDLKLKENQLVSLIAAEKSNLTAITAALNTSAAMI
ncbi:MAG: AAA family ATPase, partial [Clostridia bacterium]|nr:AAA family ATPase [Clostridia bacterium]